MSLGKDTNQYNFQKLDCLMSLAISLLVLITILFLFLVYDPTFSIFKSSEEVIFMEIIDDEKIDNDFFIRTGLRDAPGVDLVLQNCTNCHSAKLVTQNRMSKERWDATIRWMQKTQNLWELGDKQEIIVNYLVTNYPIENKGRRALLTNIEWYDLN